MTTWYWIKIPISLGFTHIITLGRAIVQNYSIKMPALFFIKSHQSKSWSYRNPNSFKYNVHIVADAIELKCIICAKQKCGVKNSSRWYCKWSPYHYYIKSDSLYKTFLGLIVKNIFIRWKMPPHEIFLPLHSLIFIICIHAVV